MAERNRRKLLEKVGIYFSDREGDFLCPRALSTEGIEA